ncbi:MAG: pyridoxamine 5'-phosphate oxidase family protein [Chloroflexota bacterium]
MTDKNFTSLTFTDSVKEMQRQFGSRASYDKMAAQIGERYLLTEQERAFIQYQDGFYLSSANEYGWPYVQYRGGAKGFLKVINEKTLAYADFRGNKQYISMGNLNENKKVMLFLMNYATQRRLKIWGTAEIISMSQNPEIVQEVIDSDYSAVVERAVIVHIEAFDWNCPQHITPRFTIEEFKQLVKQHPDLLEEFNAA